MSIIKLVEFIGNQEARLQAIGILENHPNVRRIDTLESKMGIRLILNKTIKEEELVGMLADTGLIGLRIETYK